MLTRVQFEGLRVSLLTICCLDFILGADCDTFYFLLTFLAQFSALSH